MKNPLWTFSLRLYRREDAAETCLRLQDQGGADVNLVLFALWLAVERGVSLDAGAAEAAVAATEAWRERIVQPLRQARVASKTTLLLDAAAQEGFRSSLKAVELDAERIEQAFLFGWAEERWPSAQARSAASAVDNAHVLLVANCGPAFAEAARSLAGRLAALAQPDAPGGELPQG